MAGGKAAALMALAALVAASLGPAAPAQTPGAQVDVRMASSATVESANFTQVIKLYGNLSIDKPPKLPVTVYLICTNDGGWNSECCPNEFYFLDATLAEFTCGINIPPRAGATTATVTVHAFCDGFGTAGEDYANATITVTDSSPMNGTLEQAPATWGLNSPIEKALGLTLPAIALVTSLIIIPAAAAGLYIRHRRRRNFNLPHDEARNQ